MAQLFGVRQADMPFDDANITHYVTGTVVAADVGKAVTFDTTTPTAVKLCGAGDEVVGRLETLEIRTIEGITVGNIGRAFIGWLAWDPADIANAQIGKTVIGGATPGTVKAAASPAWYKNVVVNIKVDGGTTYGLVQKLA